MSNAILNIKNLVCSYDGTPVLRINDLDIKYGKMTFFLGSSGIGKTSLLQALGMMRHNYSGEIILTPGHDRENIIKYPQTPPEKDSTELEELNDIIKNHFSFMFQETHFFNFFSIRKSFQLPLLINNPTPSKKEIKQNEKKGVQLMLKLGLDELASNLDLEVNKLSVGQRQRIAFIQAVLKKGTILFADEPTGNLDWGNSQVLFTGISNLIKSDQSGFKASIIVSHNVSLALEHADEIAILALDSDRYLRFGEKQGYLNRVVNNVKQLSAKEKSDLHKSIREIYETDIKVLNHGKEKN